MALEKKPAGQQFPDSFDELAEPSVLQGGNQAEKNFNPAQSRQDVKDNKKTQRVRSGVGQNLNISNRQRSAESAGALNEAKRGNSSSASGKKADSLREQQMADSRENSKEEEADEKGKGGGGKPGKIDKLADKATAPMKKATSNLLKQAWTNLIDSFGLTLIWINIHVFLRLVLGKKLFCKLGEEWLPPVPAASSPAGDEASKEAGKAFGSCELPVFLILDSCGCLLILLIVAQITLIVGFIENPMKAIAAVLKAIIGNLWK